MIQVGRKEDIALGLHTISEENLVCAIGWVQGSSVTPGELAGVLETHNMIGGVILSSHLELLTRRQII